MGRANCKRGGKDFLPILRDSTFLLSDETNKRRLWNIWRKEIFFTVLWFAELTVREGGKTFYYWFSWISAKTNKQTKALKYMEERKILHCIVMCRANCKRGGKDFLPILMDPEKQGEEPRKVYVTSRWPIHNLWGGATMLLSFVHQAQHSPCRPLSTKKAKKCINLNSSSPKLALFISSRYQRAPAADFKVRLWNVLLLLLF